jgi:phosphoglycolate phosphatase-like HAD superfamily hydrolase
VSYCGLVLFDIDGTLMRRAGSHHRQALVHGVRKVTGLETTTEGIPGQGMLDPAIIVEMMYRAGAKRAFTRQATPEIQRAAERYYLRVCPPLAGKHCPGVPELLERLARRGFLLALVTGNLTRIGWRKLERAGLGHFFRYGAFGEMAATRGRLVKWAVREAQRRHSLAAVAPVALVGDATSDVIAAREKRHPHHLRPDRHYSGGRPAGARAGLPAAESARLSHPHGGRAFLSHCSRRPPYLRRGRACPARVGLPPVLPQPPIAIPNAASLPDRSGIQVLAYSDFAIYRRLSVRRGSAKRFRRLEAELRPFASSAPGQASSVLPLFC